MSTPGGGAPSYAEEAGGEEAAQPSRSTPLLVAAAVLVVVVVGGVLLFGINRPPPLASLDDAPNPAPSAAVAWSAWRNGSNCLHVARPDGTVSEIRCDADGGELIGWTEDGLLLLLHGGSERVLEIDPATGDVLETRPADPDTEPPRPPDGDPVTAYTDGDVFVVELAGTELWRVEAPDGYDVQRSAVSPDEGFVAMTDTADRLLVVPADGSAPPRIWGEDVQSWTAPVWEGQAPQ